MTLEIFALISLFVFVIAIVIVNRIADKASRLRKKRLNRKRCRCEKSY